MFARAEMYLTVSAFIISLANEIKKLTDNHPRPLFVAHKMILHFNDGMTRKAS